MSVSALDWLYSTQWFGIKLGLENMRRLLDQTLAMPVPGVLVLHVAGTNGKGSVCAMADSIARHCGLRTGLFTSPHLVEFSERIRVNGAKIPAADLEHELCSLRDLVAGWDPHPTFFELTLALALRHFKASRCELLVLETGMGGRLDATNAVPSNVAVITPVGMDHCQYLGHTLAEIAAEKAGIIKPGVPVVCAAQEPAAIEVIGRAANRARAPLHLIDGPWMGSTVSLRGPHQRHNAALAIEALYRLGLPLKPENIQAGLAAVRWPGRFEHRPDHRLVLDGAHNPPGAAALAAAWREFLPGQAATLVFSALEDKDAAGMLAVLRPIAGRLIVCPADSPRTTGTTVLRAAAESSGFAPEDILECPTLAAALRAAASFPGTTLLTGSLHFVGQAIALLDGHGRQPGHQ